MKMRAMDTYKQYEYVLFWSLIIDLYQLMYKGANKRIYSRLLWWVTPKNRLPAKVASSDTENIAIHSLVLPAFG